MRFLYMGVIVPLAVLLPLAMALFFYHKLGRPEKIVAAYLLIGGIFNAAGRYLADRRMSNLWLQHVFTCLEILLVCFCFREILSDRRARQWLPVVSIVFAAGAALNSLFVQQLSVHNSYARSAAALLIVALCFYFFKTKLGSAFRWSREASFWFVTGFLVYFASSLFLFIMSNQTFGMMSNQQARTLWNIHATMVLIMYLLFTAGFWYAGRTR